MGNQGIVGNVATALIGLVGPLDANCWELPFQSIAISCFCLIACCGCFVLCSPTKLLQHLVQAVAEDRMTSTAVVGVQKTQQELTKKVLKRVTNVGK